jgi:hypothetical protein
MRCRYAQHLTGSRASRQCARFPRRAARDTLAVMQTLREVVDRYASLAKSFGEPVALSAFQLSAEETSRLFTGLDEDYHISRFLHFSAGAGQSYVIGGESVTHVALDAAISTVL